MVNLEVETVAFRAPTQWSLPVELCNPTLMEFYPFSSSDGSQSIPNVEEVIFVKMTKQSSIISLGSLLLTPFTMITLEKKKNHILVSKLLVSLFVLFSSKNI